MALTRLRGGLQLRDDTVDGGDILDATITAADIAPLSLIGDHFIDGTISADKITDGTITDSQIADRTITGIKLILNTVTVDEIDCASIAGEGLVENPTTGMLDVNIDDDTLSIIADRLETDAANVMLNSNFVDLEDVAGTKNGANTAFSLAFAPFPVTSLHIFWNGVLQQQGVGNDYELSGQNLTLAFAPKADDELKATYRKI